MLRSKRCIVQIVVEKLKMENVIGPYCGTKTFNEYEFNQQRVDYAISRRSIPMCIILSIVTFGIYGLYWLYCLASDVNTLTGEEDSSGFKVLILSIITLGLYELYWLYKVNLK